MIRVEYMPVEDAAGSQVAVVTLDRPEKRNALTPAMLEEIATWAERLTKLGRDGRSAESDGRGVEAVALLGEGTSFCAGFDLALCRDEPEAMGALLAGLSRAVRALRRLPVPVVAGARGAAVAGGCALLGGADVVITNAEAKFGYPVVKIGVSPAVSAPTLRAAIGDGAARARLLDPGLIDGREAVRIGLAHECLQRAEDVRGRTIETAKSLARKPAHAITATKRWLNELDGSSDDAMFDEALRASMELAGGEEQRRRIEAMWEEKSK